MSFGEFVTVAVATGLALIAWLVLPFDEFVTVAVFDGVAVAAVLLFNRFLGGAAAAIASLLDLLYAAASLGVALIRFRARVTRLLLRSIVAPIVGPPR